MGGEERRRRNDSNQPVLLEESLHKPAKNLFDYSTGMKHGKIYEKKMPSQSKFDHHHSSAELGSILDTVSKDTEDTAHSCILSASKIHFYPTFINGICI